MAKTASTMLALGTPAQEFSLPDVTSGKHVSLADFNDKAGLLIMFLSRHCPYVKHIQEELASLCNQYVENGVGIVAICANDAEAYPDDAPEQLQKMAETLNFKFPFLFDEKQDVAKAYTAACTPDFFLFDHHRKLAYRGQFDSSRPGNSQPVTGKDLRAALDAVLSRAPISLDQRPSIGCNIKWKPGNQPEYCAR